MCDFELAATRVCEAGVLPKVALRLGWLPAWQSKSGWGIVGGPVCWRQLGWLKYGGKCNAGGRENHIGPVQTGYIGNRLDRAHG
jgi:hypothetical protein